MSIDVDYLRRVLDPKQVAVRAKIAARMALAECADLPPGSAMRAERTRRAKLELRQLTEAGR